MVLSIPFFSSNSRGGHLQNLSNELRRLESGLAFLREEAWRGFEESLQLQELGFPEGYLQKTIASGAAPPTIPKAALAQP